MVIYKLCFATLLIWVYLSSSASAATALSSYFQICHKSDRDLAGCLKNSLTAAASAIVNGVPGLGLPKLEPLNVPSIEMKDRFGVLDFDTTLSNLNIYGMTKYIVKSVNVDQARNTVKLVINAPSINLSGKYNMNVKILTVPVRGSGDCKMSFSNVDSTVTAEVEKYTSGGVSHYRIKNFDWDIAPESATFSFSSLGDTINKFVNSNWKLAFNIYKQIPEEAFSTLIKDQVNNILANYSADELFPN